MPLELMKYIYRREFGLSAAQIEDEPTDQFFLNWQIYAWIKDKEKRITEDG